MHGNEYFGDMLYLLNIWSTLLHRRHLGVPNCTRLFHGWTPHTQGAEAEVEKNRNMLLIPITDYGRMMAKSLTLCSPNLYPNPK